jgi:HSP20 family molecular chaperone IbpA
MPKFPGRRGIGARPGPATSAHPASDAQFSELDDAYVAEVELPSVRPGEVSIELAGREVVITSTSAHKRARRGPNCAGYRIPLPTDADPGQVMTTAADGLVIITVPRSGTAGEAPGRPDPPPPGIIADGKDTGQSRSC